MQINDRVMNRSNGRKGTVVAVLGRTGTRVTVKWDADGRKGFPAQTNNTIVSLNKI